MIPYGRQHVTQADVDAVVDVLRSDFLTQGPVVPKFEAAVAGLVSARHAIAVNSATSALHVACLALGVGPGDLVWTSPISFVASANCARYCGADVDFVDIDPDTFNLSAAELEAKLLRAAALGRLPKVVIPVHLCGQSCDMEAIGELSRQFGFRIIEDASHAVGGTYRGEPVGNCRYSDIVVFSFHPVKIITSAEGGMALTNDDELARRMALFRSHGISRDREEWNRIDEGGWYYEQIELGYNYRLTELQAALGLSQLARVEAYVEARHVLARRYDELLSNFELDLPVRDPLAHSALHLYVVRVRGDERWRAKVFESLRNAGIGVNVHYIPIPMQPYYQALGAKLEAFPSALDYYRRAISIPLYPELRLEQQDAVVAALRAALTE